VNADAGVVNNRTDDSSVKFASGFLPNQRSRVANLRQLAGGALMTCWTQMTVNMIKD
jgi:hypothetical protein